MADSVYKVVEVVGTSNESISKAIGRAVSKAGATLRHLSWFEVVQIRGSIENDRRPGGHPATRPGHALTWGAPSRFRSAIWGSELPAGAGAPTGSAAHHSEGSPSVGRAWSQLRSGGLYHGCGGRKPLAVDSYDAVAR